MTPPLEGTGSRGRRKSHNACLPCRRKKSRCPGEKPACSSCTRLNQPCSYALVMSSSSRPGHSDERLAKLEEKLDRILSREGGNESIPRQQQRPGKEPAAGYESDGSYSLSPGRDRSASMNHTSPVVSETASSTHGRPAMPDVSRAIQIYFQRCHRQPIWCFEREDVRDPTSLPDELIYSIFALVSRFFSLRRSQFQRYGNDARRLIMLRLANGSVALPTIESLCLLSCSSFTDGNMSLGQFYLGLAGQLCQSAMLDSALLYTERDPQNERKKRLFWSLQLLENFYGRQTGLLCPIRDANFPFDQAPNRLNMLDEGPRPPPLPRDEMGYGIGPNEPGIWNTGAYLGWVWNRVRRYVADCTHNVLKEPWRHDSTYARVSSDFMETENRIPMCHRYDSIKFYERDVNEVKRNHDYWAPWLKEQFTYHAVPTLLNHPFLYIVAAQHNPNLAIPNTFWKRSSELALIHATWIVRIIDMIVDKQVPLTDPFFGHVAAIAATVHLYYCCAAAARLKEKSHTDFAKCRKFLQIFLPFSPACVALDRNLDRMTRIAASGSEEVEVNEWVPSRIYLSIPLMWDVLQFDCTSNQRDTGADLLDSSLAPLPHRTPSRPELSEEDSILEILVASAPEITVDTRDGGQDAPSFSWKAPPRISPMATPRTITSRGGNNNNNSSSSNNPSSMMMDVSHTSATFAPQQQHQHQHQQTQPQQQQTDNLTFNTTPWLYADPSQVLSLGDMAQWNGSSSSSQNPLGDNSRGTGAAPWWEEGSFNNAMFR